MRSFIALCVGLFSFAGHADIIQCTFTEPFVDSTYSMTNSTLTYEVFEGQKKIMVGVSFQIKGPGLFELVQNGRVIQTLSLNFLGSDGMSDMVYPYEVKDESNVTGHGSLVGGCTSNYLRESAP